METEVKCIGVGPQWDRAERGGVCVCVCVCLQTTLGQNESQSACGGRGVCCRRESPSSEPNEPGIGNQRERLRRARDGERDKSERNELTGKRRGGEVETEKTRKRKHRTDVVRKTGRNKNIGSIKKKGKMKRLERQTERKRGGGSARVNTRK